MKETCNYPTCDREVRALGLCFAHWEQQHAGKELKTIRDYKQRPEAPAGYAYCNVCESFKRVDEFYLTPSGKPRAICKSCSRAQRNRNYRRKKEAA